VNKDVYETCFVKPWVLKKLRDLTADVFSKIGTEKSRQRLVYDLLNTLRSNNRKRFLEIVLKNVNTLKSEERGKAREFAHLLSNLWLEYETSENFEKIAYAVVMGIMNAENVGGGDKNV